MRIANSYARRLVIVALTGATTIIATAFYQIALGGPASSWLAWALILLFPLLTAGIALAFWTSLAGIISLLWRGRGDAAPLPPVPHDGHADTALVMPIYNEDPAAICAGIHAMIADLDATGHGHRFHFYILSDTTDPERWVREEAAWDILVQAVAGQGKIFYRHRADNQERKTGNIADFLTRWGTQYQFAIILDADSVMAGTTLVALRERMLDRPLTALIQTNPAPVERTALWARLQQFAAALYGPVGARGLRLWAQDEGTFFGHNAIIRIRPFLEHCGLGNLPGRPPLGGAVLSHDFVEAALLVRSGWKVEFHDDLGGSWEECPTTLLDFAKRDRRWCQGNLQHVGVLVQPGLHWISRLHLFNGIMAYAGSPLWVLFLILSVAHAAMTDLHGAFSRGSAQLQIGMFIAIITTLLLPKCFGVIAALWHRRSRHAHGGVLRLIVSAALETAFAVMVAPVMMLYHTRFVLETLTGMKVQWNAQARGDQATDWPLLLREHAQHVIAGCALFIIAWSVAPWMLWWLAPVWLPLLVAVPTAALLGSAQIGIALSRIGFLHIASEREPPAILIQRRVLISADAYATPELRDIDVLARVIADPHLNHLHTQIQERTQESPSHVERKLIDLIERDGTAELDKAQRKSVLLDPDALRRLHRHVWSQWSRSRLEQALGRTLPE